MVASLKVRAVSFLTIELSGKEKANTCLSTGALHMSKVGTYNAVIPPNEFYSSEHSDFNSSHKTFKRMMPTFAWEVLEVYSGPPVIAFKWRHWGEMKADYVGFNEYELDSRYYETMNVQLTLCSEGERVTAKAHGGKIDFSGMTIARLTPEYKIKALEVWYDPLEMFRQITTDTEVTKEVVGRLGKYAMLAGEDHTTHLYGMDDAPKPKPVPVAEKEVTEPMPWDPIGVAVSETVVVEEPAPPRNRAAGGGCPYDMGGFKFALADEDRQ